MSKAYDVCVIGAGAAGLMTAITAQKNKCQVLLLDSQKKIGAKILMSGGTRCNVTNDIVSERDYNGEHLRVVRNILNSFPPEKAISFFKHLGVNLILEPDGKYFPTTHSGKTVLDALNKEIDRLGISLLTGHKVKAVRKEKNIFVIEGENFKFLSKTVVVCTGGLSYPATGSEGAGYGFAKTFGHTLVETTPALTPLLTDDETLKALSGVSFDCQLSLFIDGKEVKSYTGAFLLTHFGFSGPVCLNISRHLIRQKKTIHCQIYANLYPDLNRDDLREKLSEFALKNSKRNIKSFLIQTLPERFVEIFLNKINIAADKLCSQLKKEERQTLLTMLTRFPLSVTGVYGYKKAEVTAGGVDLADLNPKTLESKKEPGLFFAGEVVDVDGRIGGFNFQWAWSSGFVVGNAITSKLFSTKVD